MAKHSEVTRKWHLIDADGQILGRLAVKVADILRGKNKTIFTPHVDCGDGVIIINAEKIKVTGTKLTEKKYQRYSGYPSGRKEESLERLLGRRPTAVVEKAVKGVLPKNSLGREVYRRLKVYAGAKHPHAGQMAEATKKL